MSPSHGRGLIYVWAIEQDELSKRTIPTEAPSASDGQDVLVPWVLKSQQPKKKKSSKEKAPEVEPQESTSSTQERDPVFNRYYHMFAKGELRALVCEAAEQIGLQVGNQVEKAEHQKGLEIIQDGWERSNYYVELKLWEQR